MKTVSGDGEKGCRFRRAIKRHHSGWNGEVEGILIFELRTGTGMNLGEPSRLDAFFVADTPTKAYLRVAYEIKESRSDFLREIRDPRKRRQGVRLSNQFYFVTPPGIVKTEEVPLDCGLVEIGDDGRWVKVVNAPYRESHPPTWPFFAAVFRRFGKVAE